MIKILKIKSVIESLFISNQTKRNLILGKKKAIRTFWMEHLNSNASPEHYSRDALQSYGHRVIKNP